VIGGIVVAGRNILIVLEGSRSLEVGEQGNDAADLSREMIFDVVRYIAHPEVCSYGVASVRIYQNENGSDICDDT
jgi:hypothetical protein